MLIAVVFIFITTVAVVLISENAFIFRSGELRDLESVKLNLEARSLERYARTKISLLSATERLKRKNNLVRIYDFADRENWFISHFPETAGDPSSDIYIKLTSVNKPEFEYVFKY